MIAKTECNTPCDEINEYAYIETVAKHGPLLQTIDLLNTGCGGGAVSPGRVLFVRSSTHLHQEDSVMVGEDLVYSLFATPLIVFGALSGLWPLASGLWPLAKGG